MENIVNDKKNLDIQYTNRLGSFNTRVIGLCIKEEKILLGKMKNDIHWTLIGGKPQFGESTDMAILREYREETGAKIQVERLLSVTEIFFDVEGENWHQYIFMYLLKDEKNSLGIFEGTRKILDSEDGIMQWFSINELDGLVIKPNNIIDIIKDLPKELKHVINRDY